MVRKIVNEDLNTFKPHTITKDELKELNDYLNKNKCNEYIDTYRDDNSIYTNITWGDWRHDHLWIQHIVKDFFNNKGVDVEHTSTITDEDGSDTYSAEHIWTLYDLPRTSFSESANDAGVVKTLDDMLSGLVDNVPEKILDQNIKLFNRIVKELGAKDFSDVHVFIHDGTYDLGDYDDKFEFVKSYNGSIGNAKEVKVFKFGDKLLVQEFYATGRYFIYAKSENDLDALVDVIDNYYNDISDDSVEELTENKDTDFNDMYFPRINITNNDYDYYKYKDKEFVFDKSKNFLIYLFKDEDEVKELGDEAPYRELDAIGFNKEFWDDKDERDYHLDSYIADLDSETSSLLADYIKYELPAYQKKDDKETVTEANIDVNSLKETHKIYEADLNVEAEISEYDASSEDEAKENSKEAVEDAVKNMAKEIKSRIDKKIGKDNTYVDLSDHDLINFKDGIIYATIYVDKDANEEDIITVINELKGFVSFGETTFDDFDYSKGSPVSGPNIPNSYAGWMEYSEIESEVTIAIEIMSIENIKQSED